MINKENYYVIQGFMVSDLKLKGNDLSVFAIIHGFSQTSEQWFTGSLQYLADWCQSTKFGISKNLSNLIEKKLIEKQEYYINNVKICKYRSLYTYATQLHTTQLSCTNNIYSSYLYIYNKIKQDYNISATQLHTIQLWLKYKSEKGQTYKETGLRQFMKDFVEQVNKHGEQVTIESINNAMKNNWAGVHYKKENTIAPKESKFKRKGEL